MLDSRVTLQTIVVVLGFLERTSIVVAMLDSVVTRMVVLVLYIEK